MDNLPKQMTPDDNAREAATPTKFWRTLENLPKLSAKAMLWEQHLEREFPALRSVYLQSTPPDPGDRLLYVQLTDVPAAAPEKAFGRSGRCMKIEPCREEQLTQFALDWVRLGESVADALGFVHVDEILDLSKTRQIGECTTHDGATVVPIFLMIQHKQELFQGALAELLELQPDPFILLAPTRNHFLARTRKLLSKRRVLFFDLESLLQLGANGRMTATRAAEDLFADILEPPQKSRTVIPRFALLRRSEKIWDLYFEGQRTSIKDEAGLPLVAYLLDHPRDPLHGTVLDARAHRAQPLNQRNPGLDRQQSFNRLKNQMAELFEIIDDPFADDAEKVAAQLKRDDIRDELTKSIPQSAGDAANCVRAVRKAILRLRDNLEQDKTDPIGVKFAHHVTEFLINPSARYNEKRGDSLRTGTAGQFVYEAPKGFRWMVDQRSALPPSGQPG